MAALLVAAQKPSPQEILGPVPNHKKLLKKGKSELGRPEATRDYAKAVGYLKQAVVAKPNHADTQFLLGIALTGSMGHPGQQSPEAMTPVAESALAAYLKVVQVQPSYHNSTYKAGPYSEINRVYSLLAMAYLAEGRVGEARRLLVNASTKGAFQDTYIELARTVLDACQPNALLVSSGFSTMAGLLYIQLAEGYRTDVLVVNNQWLAAPWYKAYMHKITGNKVPWPSQTPRKEAIATGSTGVVDRHNQAGAPLGVFTWRISSLGLYANEDRVLLGLLQANHFVRPVYYDLHMRFLDPLGLNAHSLNIGVVSQVIPQEEPPPAYPEGYDDLLADYDLSTLRSDKALVQQSADLKMVYLAYKQLFLYRIAYLKQQGQLEQALRLAEILDRQLPAELVAFPSAELQAYEQEILSGLGQ